TVRLAMADQIDHHRHAEGVREQNELLPLVAAHPTGLGQDLDRLEPLCFGQFDLFDEGVQVLNETQHDLPQPWVGCLGKSLQYLGGDVVFGLVALCRHVSLRLCSWRRSITEIRRSGVPSLAERGGGIALRSLS